MLGGLQHYMSPYGQQLGPGKKKVTPLYVDIYQVVSTSVSDMKATEYSIQNNIFSFHIKHEIINSLYLHSSKNNIKKK